MSSWQCFGEEDGCNTAVKPHRFVGKLDPAKPTNGHDGERFLEGGSNFGGQDLSKRHVFFLSEKKTTRISGNKNSHGRETPSQQSFRCCPRRRSFFKLRVFYCLLVLFCFKGDKQSHSWYPKNPRIKNGNVSIG